MNDLEFYSAAFLTLITYQTYPLGLSRNAF
jgi:hypothetical protein